MSRLTEIVDNHENLDQLFAILKHYGVNAEFITAALLNEFERLNEDSEEDEKEEKEDTAELFEDLAQFYARF